MTIFFYPFSFIIPITILFIELFGSTSAEAFNITLQCVKYDKDIGLCNIEDFIDERPMEVDKLDFSNSNSQAGICPEQIKFINSKLTFIPTKIFEKCGDSAHANGMIYEFDISSTGITSISSSVFKAMYGVKALNISHNLLDDIPPFTFADGKVLESLDVSYNLLEKIDGKIFSGLVKLKMLDLSNNEINTIEKNAFVGLESLEVLKLCNNSLATLDPSIFGKIPIKFLHIHNNQLINFDLPSFNISLDTIDLSNNKLTVYTQDEVFMAKNMILNHNELTKLNLLGPVYSLEAHHNKISDFEISTEVHIINLSNNQIKDFKKFSELVALRQLDLSFNELAEFQDSSFASLKNLEELYIQRSNLKTIHLGTFYMQMNLRVLDISYNELKSINLDHFIAMNVLEELYIDGNSLTEIKQEDIENIFREIKVISISHNNWDCTYLTTIIKRMNSRHIKVIGDLEDEEKDSKTVMGIKCSDGPYQPIDYSKYEVPSHHGGIIKQQYEDMNAKVDIVLTEIEFIKWSSKDIHERVIKMKEQLDKEDKDILNIKPIFPAVEYTKQFEALNKQMDKITVDLDEIREYNVKIIENNGLVGDSHDSDLYAKVNSQNVLIILIFVLALSFVLVKVVKFVYVRRIMFNRVNTLSSSADPIIVEENL